MLKRIVVAAVALTFWQGAAFGQPPVQQHIAAKPQGDEAPAKPAVNSSTASIKSINAALKSAEWVPFTETNRQGRRFFLDRNSVVSNKKESLAWVKMEIGVSGDIRFLMVQYQCISFPSYKILQEYRVSEGDLHERIEDASTNSIISVLKQATVESVLSGEADHILSSALCSVSTP